MGFLKKMGKGAKNLIKKGEKSAKGAVKSSESIAKSAGSISNNSGKISALSKEITSLENKLSKYKKEENSAAARRAFKTQASIEANVYRASIHDLIMDIRSNIDTMHTQHAYLGNIVKHKKLLHRNVNTIKQEQITHKNDIQINDRKAYYENEAIQGENTWNWCIHFMYGCIWIGIVIFLCITFDNEKHKPKILIPKNIALLVLLLIYPIIIYPMSTYLYEWTTNSISYLKHQLPKDVYLKV